MNVLNLPLVDCQISIRRGLKQNTKKGGEEQKSPIFLSQEEKFAYLPILMIKVTYEIKQICIYHNLFVELLHPVKVRKLQPMFQNEFKILIHFLSCMEFKNF